MLHFRFETAHYYEIMRAKTVIVFALLSVSAYVSALLASPDESLAIGTIVRLIPQEIAGWVGMALSGGRWTLLLSFLALNLLFRVQFKPVLIILQIVFATTARCAAIFVSKPPETMMDVAGELITELVLTASVFIPASLFTYLVLRVFTQKESSS